MPRVTAGCMGSSLYPLWATEWEFRVARLAGADTLWVPDHFVGFMPAHVWTPETTKLAEIVPSTDAFYDPFQLLAATAVRIGKVRLGTSVTEVFRNHPVRVAQTFVTLDHLSKGRAILGIGNGERENVEPFGIEWGQRVARLEEALTIIDLLWSSGGKPVSYDGKFWKLRDAIFALPLYENRRPPVWVAAHAPRMLALTGRFGDGWLPTIAMPPHEYSSRLATILEAGAAAGRPMEDFVPGFLAPVILGRSQEEILEAVMTSRIGAANSLLAPSEVWRAAGKRHPLGDNHGGFQDIVPSRVTPEHIDTALAELTPEIVLSSVFAGNPDEVAGQLAPLVEAGARHIAVWSTGQSFTGGGFASLWRLAKLIRKLKRL